MFQRKNILMKRCLMIISYRFKVFLGLLAKIQIFIWCYDLNYYELRIVLMNNKQLSTSIHNQSKSIQLLFSTPKLQTPTKTCNQKEALKALSFSGSYKNNHLLWRKLRLIKQCQKCMFCRKEGGQKQNCLQEGSSMSNRQQNKFKDWILLSLKIKYQKLCLKQRVQVEDTRRQKKMIEETQIESGKLERGSLDRQQNSNSIQTEEITKWQYFKIPEAEKQIRMLADYYKYFQYTPLLPLQQNKKQVEKKRVGTQFLLLQKYRNRRKMINYQKIRQQLVKNIQFSTDQILCQSEESIRISDYSKSKQLGKAFQIDKTVKIQKKIQPKSNEDRNKKGKWEPYNDIREGLHKNGKFLQYSDSESNESITSVLELLNSIDDESRNQRRKQRSKFLAYYGDKRKKVEKIRRNKSNNLQHYRNNLMESNYKQKAKSGEKLKNKRSGAHQSVNEIQKQIRQKSNSFRYLSQPKKNKQQKAKVITKKESKKYHSPIGKWSNFTAEQREQNSDKRQRQNKKYFSTASLFSGYSGEKNEKKRFSKKKKKEENQKKERNEYKTYIQNLKKKIQTEKEQFRNRQYLLSKNGLAEESSQNMLLFKSPIKAKQCHGYLNLNTAVVKRFDKSQSEEENSLIKENGEELSHKKKKSDKKVIKKMKRSSNNSKNKLQRNLPIIAEVERQKIKGKDKERYKQTEAQTQQRQKTDKKKKKTIVRQEIKEEVSESGGKDKNAEKIKKKEKIYITEVKKTKIGHANQAEHKQRQKDREGKEKRKLLESKQEISSFMKRKLNQCMYSSIATQF